MGTCKHEEGCKAISTLCSVLALSFICEELTKYQQNVIRMASNCGSLNVQAC